MQMAARDGKAERAMIEVLVLVRRSKPMHKFRHVARAAIVGAIALLVTSGTSAAQDATRPLATASRHHAATHRHSVTKFARPAATGRVQQPTAFALASPAPAAQKKQHHLILQVNTNDAAAMNLALNNATNVTQYYQERGEPVKVEVVAFGPGLHMLRDDTSPVKARIETMALSAPEVSFKACGNTQENMHKAENKDIPIIPQAQLVKSGVVHIMELEEQGWTYIKP
jgi:intracellular sulfur oxidation DsrE/DsrF family protein